MAGTNVKLEYPVKLGSEVITEVTLSRPKAKHLKAAGAYSNTTEASIAILAECSNLPVSVIDELDMVDYMAMSKVLEDFQKKSPATGPKS